MTVLHYIEKKTMAGNEGQIECCLVKINTTVEEGSGFLFSDRLLATC